MSGGTAPSPAQPGGRTPAGAELRIVALLCLAEALSMTGFATYPALLPRLVEAWALSGAEAGVVAGAYFAGYMLAVPLLSGLTDRVDARRVYFASTLLAAAGSAGFALFAGGVLSAALCQALVGAGLAGTYMPGLKALTDRVAGPRQSRYVSFYTATFGVGTSLSLLLAGGLAALLSWQWAFALAAAGPLAAGALVLRALAPLAPQRTAGGSLVKDLGSLLGNRGVLGYVLGYGAHCWELFGLRSWMVAFLAFAYAQHAQPGWLPAPAVAAAAINLLGIPASILGNEAAMRRDRRRYILGVMAASAALAWVAGLSVALSPWLVIAALALYYVFVMADSAALTAGLVAVAPPMQRGAAMAVYSLAGFGAGFAGPLVFGAVLDAAGGREAGFAWTLAVASLGLGCAVAPLAARWRGRPAPRDRT